jgi:hypothetical protein
VDDGQARTKTESRPTTHWTTLTQQVFLNDHFGASVSPTVVFRGEHLERGDSPVGRGPHRGDSSDIVEGGEALATATVGATVGATPVASRVHMGESSARTCRW